MLKCSGSRRWGEPHQVLMEVKKKNAACNTGLVWESLLWYDSHS